MTEPEPAHARRATAVDRLIGAIDRLSQLGAVLAVGLLLAAVLVMVAATITGRGKKSMV